MICWVRRSVVVALIVVFIAFLAYQLFHALYFQSPLDSQKVYDSIKQIERLLEHLLLPQ